MKIIKSNGYKKLSKKYPLKDPKGSPADKFWDWPEYCIKGKKKDLADKDKELKELLNRKKVQDPERDDWDDLILSRRPPIF